MLLQPLCEQGSSWSVTVLSPCVPQAPGQRGYQVQKCFLPRQGRRRTCAGPASPLPLAVWPHSQSCYNSRQCQQSVLKTCNSVSQFPNSHNTIAPPFSNLHRLPKGRVGPSLPLALAGWRCGDSPLLSLFTPSTSLVLLLRAVQPSTGKAVCPVLKGDGSSTIQTIVIKQITICRKQSAAFLEVSTDTSWCPAEH